MAVLLNDQFHDSASQKSYYLRPFTLNNYKCYLFLFELLFTTIRTYIIVQSDQRDGKHSI